MTSHNFLPPFVVYSNLKTYRQIAMDNSDRASYLINF